MIKSTAIRIVREDGLELYRLKEFRDDFDVVLAAVRQNGRALRYASNRLIDDPVIIMTALRQDPWLLHLASRRLQDNKDIVMSSVSRDGLWLQYASERLRGFDPEYIDEAREVVMTAVKSDGNAIKFASPQLQRDIDILIAAEIADQDSTLFVPGVERAYLDSGCKTSLLEFLKSQAKEIRSKKSANHKDAAFKALVIAENSGLAMNEPGDDCQANVPKNHNTEVKSLKNI